MSSQRSAHGLRLSAQQFVPPVVDVWTAREKGWMQVILRLQLRSVLKSNSISHRSAIVTDFFCHSDGRERRREAVSTGAPSKGPTVNWQLAQFLESRRSTDSERSSRCYRRLDFPSSDCARISCDSDWEAVDEQTRCCKTACLAESCQGLAPFASLHVASSTKTIRAKNTNISTEKRLKLLRFAEKWIQWKMILFSCQFITNQINTCTWPQSDANTPLLRNGKILRIVRKRIDADFPSAALQNHLNQYTF